MGDDALPPLRGKLKRTMIAIDELERQLDQPPTYRELARVLGVSPSAAYQRVARLIQDGYVMRWPGRQRSLDLTAAARAWMASRAAEWGQGR